HSMRVAEGLAVLRKQGGQHIETIYYCYVIGADQRLLGVVSFRELFDAQAGQHIRDVMRTSVVTVTEHTAQEDIARLFQRSGLIALPVVDDDGHMHGIITADDVVHALSEQATKDIQRIGGSEALGLPYLEI